MDPTHLLDRLAVCSWSLEPATPRELIERVNATDVRRVQLLLDPLRDAPDVWGGTPELLREAGLGVASGMFRCAGEDYSTLETIRNTGGIAPDTTWEENWRNIRKGAVLAEQLGLKLVTFHAGFLPHDERAPDYSKLLGRLRQVADEFGARDLALGLETGQETAPALLGFLEKLERANVGVNFDPANMLLYDQGDPIEALQTLAPWLRQVHLKDAVRTQTPGTWGEEVTVGTGEVNWTGFFAALERLGFQGDLCIEREAGTRRVEDVRAARLLMQRITAIP